MSSIYNIVKDIVFFAAGRREEAQKLRDRASVSFRKAMTETELYCHRLEGGKARSEADEIDLVRLWSDASTECRHHKDLAAWCLQMSRFWMLGDSVPDVDFKKVVEAIRLRFAEGEVDEELEE